MLLNLSIFLPWFRFYCFWFRICGKLCQFICIIFSINQGRCIILRISDCNICGCRLVFRFYFWSSEVLAEWLSLGLLPPPTSGDLSLAILCWSSYLCFSRHISWWRGNCRRNSRSRCCFCRRDGSITPPPLALDWGLLEYSAVA